MSPTRTLRIPARLSAALAGSAVALAAVVSGTGTHTAPVPAPAAPAAAPAAVASAAAVQAATGVRSQAASAGPHAILLAYSASRHHRTSRQVARSMLHRFHWSSRQFKYLNRLWMRESGWNRHAYNPYSGAYGIPQADPGSKMASAGPHWRYNATTQIRWGLRYIRGRYGSPRRAWNHEVAYGWY